ncbi:MAG: hypothetical protein RIM72_11000 [Alphaproteobacteria bacterium]
MTFLAQYIVSPEQAAARLAETGAYTVDDDGRIFRVINREAAGDPLTDLQIRHEFYCTCGAIACEDAWFNRAKTLLALILV